MLVSKPHTITLLVYTHCEVILGCEGYMRVYRSLAVRDTSVHLQLVRLDYHMSVFVTIPVIQ